MIPSLCNYTLSFRLLLTPGQILPSLYKPLRPDLFPVFLTGREENRSRNDAPKVWYNKNVMKKSEPINKIRKCFHREWLLIAVDQTSPKTYAPLTGRLLFHSPHRDEVHDAIRRWKKRLTLVTYSDDRLPAGYALAL